MSCPRRVISSYSQSSFTPWAGTAHRPATGVEMEPSRRSLRTRRARLVLNRLEERDVPAGIVTVSSTGGHFVLTGDDFDNSVTVSMTTGANADVTITPDATTTIDDLSIQGGGTM